MDLACTYDDSPAMVLGRLADLGFDPEHAAARFLAARLDGQRWPVNTSGGQLSAGQAGAAGGMHGLVEVVAQLRGGGGARQVDGARLGVATGYGMGAYRYGACANVVVVERWWASSSCAGVTSVGGAGFRSGCGARDAEAAR